MIWATAPRVGVVPAIGLSIVSEDPTTAVEEHHRGQRPSHALGPDDADGDLAIWTAWDGAVLDVSRRLGHLDSLFGAEHLARVRRRQLVDRRPAGGRQRVEKGLDARGHARRPDRGLAAGVPVSHFGQRQAAPRPWCHVPCTGLLALPSSFVTIDAVEIFLNKERSTTQATFEDFLWSKRRNRAPIGRGFLGTGSPYPTPGPLQRNGRD